MNFGIVTAKIDAIGYITHAENLGYSHCWVTDSQMPREQQGLHQIMLYLPLKTGSIGSLKTSPSG